MPSTNAAGASTGRQFAPAPFALGHVVVWTLGLTASLTGWLLAVQWRTSPVVDVARATASFETDFEAPHGTREALLPRRKPSTEGAKIARA